MDNSECELAALNNDPQFLHAILKPSFVLYTSSDSHSPSVILPYLCMFSRQVSTCSVTFTHFSKTQDLFFVTWYTYLYFKFLTDILIVLFLVCLLLWPGSFPSLGSATISSPQISTKLNDTAQEQILNNWQTN